MCLAEPLQDLLALRYCLCSIARCMALQFAEVEGSPFGLHLRRMLFLACSTWTEEGAIPGQSTCELKMLSDSLQIDPDVARYCACQPGCECDWGRTGE